MPLHLDHRGKKKEPGKWLVAGVGRMPELPRVACGKWVIVTC
jgi:hypothetical protein